MWQRLDKDKGLTTCVACVTKARQRQRLDHMCGPFSQLGSSCLDHFRPFPLSQCPWFHGGTYGIYVRAFTCTLWEPGDQKDHSGAERSPGKKKHIIGGSYIVWNVCAVRFGNSWRKNMALGSFGILEKYGIFGVFWPFLVSFSLSRAVSACFWHCIWHLPTPDICLTHSDTILTLPDTLRHHPDTHQTPPYLVCMRPLGERVISEYHDIYSTGLNLYGIYPPQTSTWHTQTPYRHCQTPSDTIQTPLRNLNFTVIGLYRISILLVSSCQSPRPTACAATTWTTSITSHQTLYAVYIAHIVHRNVSTAASSDPSFYSPNMSLTSLVSSLVFFLKVWPTY